MTPLSEKQLHHLSRLAERAFNLETAKARGRGDLVTQPHLASLDTFRHHHLARLGRYDLDTCNQGDYRTVEGHFLDLLGETGQALNSLLQGEANPRRVATAKLLEACRQFNLHPSYAEAICRRQNGGQGLDDVNEKRLWCLVYTIRNRGRAKAQAVAA